MDAANLKSRDRFVSELYTLSHMKNVYTSRMQKELKKLADAAHKRESECELGKLMSRFKEWKAGTLDYSHLNEMINEFHDIINRTIWKTYQFDPDFIVTRALFMKLLAKKELSAELRKALKPKLDNLERMIGGKDAKAAVKKRSVSGR
jgi:hypothetical protein